MTPHAVAGIAGAPSEGPPAAPPTLRKKIILRSHAVERLSARAPEFEWLELHLVNWTLTFGQGGQTLRSLSTRLAVTLETVFGDVAGAPPLSAGARPLAAIPLANVTTDEAAALIQHGWAMEMVTRLWTGGLPDDVPAIAGASLAATGITPDDPHYDRAARTAARAARLHWAYFRSTQWGFIYRKPTPKRGR